MNKKYPKLEVMICLAIFVLLFELNIINQIKYWYIELGGVIFIVALPLYIKLGLDISKLNLCKKVIK